MTAIENIVPHINYGESNIPIASSPSSSNSCLSGDGSCVEDKDTIPPSLIEDELQLALNKDAGIEELEAAVSRCRELVLESEQCSMERKWLVRHLVELRLRLQECKDALTDPTHPKNTGSSVNTRVILGHHLMLQPLLSAPVRNRHCDQCASSIWSMLQAWYQCADCGYSCHHKCLSHIVRVCVHLTAAERGTYITDICPERGLSAQRYQCAECRAPLTFGGTNGWTEARLCDYNGGYYCSACHWNTVAVIPARVIHNWDLEKRAVCQASAQLLRLTSRQPLIHLERLNPRLFTFISELSFVKKLREELMMMRKYLSVCRIAQSEHLLWKLGSRQHLIDSDHMYSLQDLVDVHAGELAGWLQSVGDLFTRHIQQDCTVCRGRGHLCEVCGHDEPLFPFQSGVVPCPTCQALFHRGCWTRRKERCPRCLRRQKRNIQNEGSDNNCDEEDNLNDNKYLLNESTNIQN